MNTQVRDAILAEIKAARDIGDLATKENRDLTGEERAKVTTHIENATKMRVRETDKADLAKQLGELADGIGMEPDEKAKVNPDQYAPVGKARSLGKSFVDSAEYKDMVGNVPPGGYFSEKSRVQSAPYGVKDLLTGADHATSAGALTVPQRLGLLDPFYQRPLTIRQLVTNGTTGSDTIEYVKLVTATNNAAPVPEATTTAEIGSGTPAVTTVQGGLKPEGALVFQKATTTVKTIAEWIPATKRALSDAAQVRTLIDAFLMYGLEEELEDQIVAGNGVGENFNGLIGTSGIQTQAAPGAGQDVFDITRMARRKVRIGGRSIPTAFVLNPIDWEAIELKRNVDGIFYGAGPFSMMTPSLWGLPVVESEAMPAGTGFVADWSKAVLWDREQASIQVTDSHADFFIRNLVAILAELRAAFAVLRPSAFVKITL